MSADWTNNLSFDFLSEFQRLRTWMNRQLRPEVICHIHTHSEQPWRVGDKPQPKMTTTYGAKAYGITQLTLRLRVRLICKMSNWSKDAESDAQTNQTSANATCRRTAYLKCQVQLCVKGAMCINSLLVLLKHYFGCVRARRRVLRAPRSEKKTKKKTLNASFSSAQIKTRASYRVVTHTIPQVGSYWREGAEVGLILADLECFCFTNIWKKNSEKLVLPKWWESNKNMIRSSRYSQDELITIQRNTFKNIPKQTLENALQTEWWGGCMFPGWRHLPWGNALGCTMWRKPCTSWNRIPIGPGS